MVSKNPDCFCYLAPDVATVNLSHGRHAVFAWHKVDIDNLQSYGSCQCQHRSSVMWFCNLLLIGVVLALAGCKQEDVPVENRLVRAVVVDLKAVGQDRYAIGEVKPRYESDLSFRVGGKVLSRLVDVGASVNQGDTLATLDTQDYRNRLRSAEADVHSADAALVEAQGAERRQGRLLKDGWTTRATYDTVLRNLRTAEAK